MTSTPYPQWCFLSYIRLFDSGQEQNNVVRIDYDVGAGTVSADIEVAAGLYVVGINGEGDDNSLEVGPWNGDPTDYELFGVNSLFRALAAAVNTELSTLDINIGLETASSIAGSDDPSGKVIVSMNGVSTNFVKFLWTHANTNMDPAWFGMAKTGGVYATSSDCYGNAETVISDMSSTLALVGQKVIGAEPQYEGYLETGITTGSGKTNWKRFGTGVEQISEFIVKVGGLPRNSVDSGFHSFRRWARQLVFNRARKRFIYIPDLQKPTGANYPRQWDPDDLLENRRWGWRDLTIDPLRTFRFEDVQQVAQSNQLWKIPTPVRSFVA